MSQWKLSSQFYTEPSTSYDQHFNNAIGEQPRFLDLNYASEFEKQWKTLGRHADSTLPLGVIGLGGSSLGLKAILGASWPETLQSRIVFFDNIDPSTHYLKLDSISDLTQMNWIVISKSGKTMETLTIFESIFQYYRSKKITGFEKKVFFVSEKKENPLSKIAESWKRPLFKIPTDLGGRFSIFSAVGLLPLALMGLDREPLIRGAQEGFLAQSLILKLCQFFHSNPSSLSTLYFCTYTDRLLHTSAWMNQLWSESLGKSMNADGNRSSKGVGPLIPFRGASDQHSILQQVLEGPFEKKMIVLRSKDSEKSVTFNEPRLFETYEYKAPSMGRLIEIQTDATLKTLRNLKIQNAEFSTESLSPENIGFLMGSLMVSVVTIAQQLKINAYDQPAVEIGKDIVRANLSQ